MKYGKRLCLQLESENSSSRGSTSTAAKAVFEKQESSEAQVAKFLWARLPLNAVDYDEPTGADDDILSTAVDWLRSPAIPRHVTKRSISLGSSDVEGTVRLRLLIETLCGN